MTENQKTEKGRKAPHLSANYPFSDLRSAQQRRDRDVDIPCQTELAIRLGVSRQAVNIAFGELDTAGLLPEWITFRNVTSTDVERQIQNRLKAELGGEVEVVTAVARIDLLTETEVIEIQNIDDWKEALGKILAYSALKPEHSKRIHLFGKQDWAKLALAQGTCSEFGVAVTFEEVWQ